MSHPSMPIMFARSLAAGLMLAAAVAGASASPPSAAPDATRVANAQAKTALDLVIRLAAPDRPMRAVSPASLAGAAVALELGASDQLRGALHAALGFAGSEHAAADLAAVRERLAKLANGLDANASLKLTELTLFDRRMALRDSVAPAFHKAGLAYEIADFRAPDFVKKVNDTISRKTGGHIPEMISRAPDAASVLAFNALYFKDRWKAPFERGQTKPAAFKRLAGGTVMVPTMHLPQGRYNFRQDERFEAIDLPFADERFSMVLLAPRGEEPKDAQSFVPAMEWLTGAGFAPVEGDLALPRFDISSREDLTQILDALGLKEARLAPDALSRFSDEPGQITRVLQRVEVRLDEEGAEAAAATAAMVERGISSDYVRMVVDKPFMFALRDKKTGLILAAGYVGEPVAATATARRTDEKR